MQKIGIGFEFYKKMIDKKCYYVDKTLLIRDVVENGGEVTLFTRPRRFGKTMALTMLQAFFEEALDRNGNPVDNSRYFEGKKIMDAGEEIVSMMGKYPVIFLTLKSAKQPTFENAFYQLASDIMFEVSRHDYLLKSDRLAAKDRLALERLLNIEVRPYFLPDDEKRLAEDIAAFSKALKILSVCLEQYHGRNAIILLDEYDVPLENAYYAGFYDRMVGFIRALFEASLKTNPALEFAVVTGCLRISKESIFTGLNHLFINSVRSTGFSEGFGFTQEETEAMLSAYGLQDWIEEVRDWYNGYLFGETEIYNPWSVTYYVYGKVVDKKKFPEPYWANTSSNAIIKDLVAQADENMKEELERLIDFETIEKKIHEDITYDDVHQSEDNLWNFLFFTGYLRKVSERFEGEDIYMTMRIPDREIRHIYNNQIRNWFDNVVKGSDRSGFHQAVLSGDTDEMGAFVVGLLEQSISTFDSRESFYHGFLLSLLIGTPGYTTRSNREEGNGRPDIVLYPLRPKDPAIIFECKIRKKFNQMEEGIQEAFDQIRNMNYEEGILDDGYAGAVSYGVCFCKKNAIFRRK